MEARDRFENYRQVVGDDPLKHRSLLLDCLNSAIEAVQPSNLLASKLRIISDDHLKILGTEFEFDLPSFDRVIVVGTGKASGAMAESLETILPSDLVYSGVVIIPEGTSRSYRTSKIKLAEGTHPVPSLKSVRSATKVLEAAKQATGESLVICLISGGGSALMSLPAEGITLGDKIKVTSLLLKSGAGIEKINCVRKHLSVVKGGQLARASNGATVLSLIISDIVGNPIESIASGPTVPDSSTFGDALKILEDYKLVSKVPKRILRRLKAGTGGHVQETPKPNDPIFRRVTNFIIGDNTVACAAAVERLKETGYFVPYYLGSSWQGEARYVAANLVEFSLEIRKNSSKLDGFRRPCGFVWGGETTVTVKGGGKGGRNQEEALSGLIKIDGTAGVSIAFMGTDGVDGFTHSAGALVNSLVSESARSKKLDPGAFLENNDSNTFFKKVGGSLLTTGPTGTNVNDIGIALIEDSEISIKEEPRAN